MTWINPLDRLPQIRQDYANHMLWAAFGWVAVMLVCPLPNRALAILALVGAVKKLADYVMADTPERRQAESVRICLAKAVATALGAAIPWAGWMLAQL